MTALVQSIHKCLASACVFCVNINTVLVMDTVSDSATLKGDMPQGFWLSPLIILVDDLRLRLLTHKFVDDTTLLR